MPQSHPDWLQTSRFDKSVRISVYVQPGAKVTAVAGDFNGALKIKISAPPVDGAANEALREFIAELLGIAPRNVALVRGELSRHKIFEVQGLSPEQIRLKLVG